MADRNKPKESDEEFVRFVGPFNGREITAEQWARAGVPDHETVRWDKANGYVVPKSELGLSDDDFNRIIAADSYFRVVTGDDAKVSKGVHTWPPAM